MDRCSAKVIGFATLKKTHTSIGNNRQAELHSAMDFLVIVYDFTDSEALNRRMAVREAHLVKAREAKQAGKLIAGGAILDDSGKMIGSSMFARFDTREELDAHIAADPYVTGKVWDKIEVKTVRLAIQ
jgi:uncharacterized protein YciI